MSAARYDSFANGAPTWIDASLALEWQRGIPERHNHTIRWFVYLDQSGKAFGVMSGNDGHGSFGGDDAAYEAVEIASAIERWATSISGLEADPQFLEALERNVQKAIATGTRLEIIRSKYLLDAMRARVDIAKAKDALPFAGFGQPQVEYEGDDLVEFAPLILAWDDAR